MSIFGISSSIPNGEQRLETMETKGAAFDVLVATGLYNFTVQVAQPTTGQNVVMSDGLQSLVLKHTSLLATLTVTFPSNPKDGQPFSIGTKQFGVTLLTLTAPGASIINALGTLAALGYASWFYSSDIASWVRNG